MEKISVAIRVRPVSKQEDAGPWKLGANSITFCNASSASTQAFTFDQVFAPVIPTSQIYRESAKDVIASAVQGFNGTIFAYGQTSSGKTYTMRGCPQEPGIIPLALADVFHLIDEACDREFLIRVSYMEIYNEEINDLLAPESQKLQVHENLERGIFVAGLREEIVSSPEQVMELLTFGEAHRRVGETNMNVYSSRSHTIFRMVIESRDMQDSTTSEACDAVRVSVLNLVDLAGSERVSKTGAEGARLKEGTHINKSLMTLGNVINKLSEGIHKHGGHVPYRDSKLTRILQPALGGNAKTTIICNITPALIHADETKGTLQFASRANRVTNCAQVNEVMTDAALLKRQKKEIEDLRSKLQESHSDHLEDEILSLRNNLLKFELERERLALELVENERRLKEQEQKIEKLGTMVINSAIDDRAYTKKGSRRDRRETWCPRIPSLDTTIKTPDFKQPLQKGSSTEGFSRSTKRMPPPFEMLLEHDEECSMWSSQELYKDLDHDERDIESVSERGAHVVQRERSLPSSLDDAEQAIQESAGLHLQYQVLQSEHDRKMTQVMLEINQLKTELANAHAQLNAGGKLVPEQPPVPAPLQDQMCKILGGGDMNGSESIISDLQSQVHTLELERLHMQRELNQLMEEAKEQTTITPDDQKEDITKTGSMGDSGYLNNLELPAIEKHDVECQTVSVTSSDEDEKVAEMYANLMDSDQGLCHCCARDDSYHASKAIIPDPVTALREDLARLETEKAELSLKLAKAEQNASYLGSENARLNLELCLKASIIEEMKNSPATSSMTVCRDGVCTPSDMCPRSKLTSHVGHEEKMQTGMVCGLEASRLLAEEPGSEGAAIQLGTAAAQFPHHGEAQESLSRKSNPAIPDTLGNLESLLERHVCGGCTNEDSKKGVMLTTQEVLKIVELHVQDLLQRSVSDYEAEKTSLIKELQNLTNQICLGLNLENAAKDAETRFERGGVLNQIEPIQLPEPVSCAAQTSEAATTHVSTIDPAWKLAGRYTVLEAVKGQINVFLEKVQELWLPHADMQDANCQRLHALQQVESLKQKLILLEEELGSKLSHVQHLEEQLNGIQTLATRERFSEDMTTPEQEVICQEDHLLIAKTDTCDTETMLSKSYTDSASSPGNTPSGLSITTHGPDNQVEDLHEVQCSSDVSIGLEALRHNNETLSAQLEESNRKLEVAKVELFTYKSKLTEIELLLVDKDEQYTVLCGRLRDLEQEKVYFESESSQSHSDLLALRKELASLRMAPLLVEKERDALRKELDMHKTKSKEIQAKLKSTLQDKSKLEADKANVERELKHLRGSTLLQRDINRRESIAEKRRESMAPALSKTKQQLSSLEQALQMRTTELEKASFDIEVLQELCSKLEFSVLEAENLGTTLKDQLTSAETTLETLKEESKLKDDNSARLKAELEETSEQWKASVLEKEALQQQSASLAARIEEHEATSQSKLAELMKENEDLVQQLTDAYTEFEVEKSAWAGRMKDHCDKVSKDAHEKVARLEEQEAASQLRMTELMNENKGLFQQLTDAYTEFEVEKAALTRRLQDQCDDAHKKLELLNSQLNVMQARCTVSEEETAEVKQELTAELGARLAQSNQIRQMSSALQEYVEVISGLEKKCTEISTVFCDKIDHITEEHNARIKFLSEKLLESEQLIVQLAKSLESSNLPVNEMQMKARKGESSLPLKLFKEEATMELTEWAQTAASSVLSNSKIEEMCSRVDLEAENNLLKEYNMQLSTSNLKLQVGLQCTKEREEVYKGRLKEALWEIDGLNRNGQLHRRHSGVSQMAEGGKTVEYRKLQEEVAASRLEIEDLVAELAKARAQCSELMQDPGQDRILEIENENCNLKHRVKIAEERAKFRRDIIRKLREEAKTREASSEEAGMKELMFQKCKLEDQVRQLTTELEFISNQVNITHLQYSGNTAPLSPVPTMATNSQTPRTRREGSKIVAEREGCNTPSYVPTCGSGRVPLTPINQNIVSDGLRTWGSQSRSKAKA